MQKDTAFKNISKNGIFWENSVLASKTLSEKSKLESVIKTLTFLEKDLKDLTELYHSFKNDEDPYKNKRYGENIKKKCPQMQSYRHYYQEKLIITIILEIHTGAGGTESQRLGRNTF